MICALCPFEVGSGRYTNSKGQPVHYWCEQKRIQDGSQETARKIKRGEPAPVSPLLAAPVEPQEVRA